MGNQVKFEKRYISYSDYVQGNAVRKANTVEIPERAPRTYVDGKRVKESGRTIRNRERALRMSVSYVMLLAVCSVVLFTMCVKYLTLHDSISAQKGDIAKLEMNIESLKAQNDSLDYSINSFMDIDYISKVATEQLGMVQASKNQILFYQNTASEYMKQYKEVPSK